MAGDLFFELYADLPREGPGDEAATRKAYSLLGRLPPRPEILDIGCGSGAQTLVLATLSPGRITAVDFHRPYLDRLLGAAKHRSVADRIRIRHAKMEDLDITAASVDLIWSEGAIYIVGFENGLNRWQRFLKPGGYIAVSEITWLQADRPEELDRFWGACYPDMKDIDGNLAAIANTGLTVIDHFTLPPFAWWENYYAPLEQRLLGFQETYRDNAAARPIVAETRREIELYKRFGEFYGYEFYVMQKPCADA